MLKTVSAVGARRPRPHSYLTVEMNVIELHIVVQAQMLSDGTIERSGNENGIYNMTDTRDLFGLLLSNIQRKHSDSVRVYK